jgi:hypothetical protein
MKKEITSGLEAYTPETSQDFRALGPFVYHLVTESNIEDIREMMAAGDQAEEIYPGCVTWGIQYSGGQRGQMTVYPKTGRAAVCFGGDSIWGDWSESDAQMTDDNGQVWDTDGNEVETEEEEDEDA